MRIIGGMNYHKKLDTMIQECVELAKQNPFESYIFIVDHPLVVEKLFFQYTKHLVNIEIMNFSQFLKQQLITQRLTHHHVLNQIEWTYHLRNLLQQLPLSCFTHQQIYPLIEKFIPLLKEYDLNHILYQDNQFNQNKLNDFIMLYNALLKRCDEDTHLTLESVFDHCDFQYNHTHIYIEGDHLYQQKQQAIIKRLSHYHDVTLMYTYNGDNRLFNMPYHQLCTDATHEESSSFLLDNLFLQSPQHNTDETQYYTFVSPTPHQEVKRVIYNIYQRVVDEGFHYHDFMIIYPDSSYKDILVDELNTFHIPHHLPITHSCVYDYSYQLIISAIPDILADTIDTFAYELDKLDLDTKYHQYLQSLMIYTDSISNQEFIDFFKATCHLDSSETMNTQDYISICSLEQAQSDHLQYIYILGMNETILPRAIKDTALLLDEDIALFKRNNINTPLSTLEQLGVHYNDILKVLSQNSLSMTFSYCIQTLSGETLLPSSLYKQLQLMFNLKKEPTHKIIPLDKYYQQGGQSPDKSILNENIQDYLKSKNQPELLDIKDLYSDHLSVSQIESYNKCPFSYFIQYGLGIYPPYEQKLMPNELGSLVHYILSIGVDQEISIEEKVNEYIQTDESLCKKIHSSSINLYFIEQLKKDLQITLQVVKRQVSLSSFHIVSKEEKVTDTIRGMNFKGFVDRIDEHNQKVAIIDYKSSAKDIDLNLAMQGFNIQMLLYLKMVAKEKDPSAVLYFNTKKRILSLDQSLSDPIDEKEFYKQYRYGGYIIDDESHSTINAIDPHMDKRSDIVNVTYVKTKNEYKGHILSPQQLDVLLKKIEDHIYDLYQHILSGDIGIRPKGSDQSGTHAVVNPCRYCPYHSVCSFDVFYNDYELVSFLNVDEVLGGGKNAI